MSEFEPKGRKDIERARRVGLIISGINQMVYVEPDTYRPSPYDIQDTREGYDIDGNYHRIGRFVLGNTEEQL